MYERAAHGDPVPEANILRKERFTDQDGVEHEFLLKIGNYAGPFQAAMLTNGRLVLSASTYIHEDLVTQILEKLADSVVFEADAPKTLNDLYGTVAERTSLEEVLEQNGRGGGDPCGIVCQDAEASRKLTPTPAVSTMLSTEAQNEEALAPLGSVPADRKSLPANWWTPIFVSSGVLYSTCGSSFHTGRAAMAIDTGVVVDTPVYAAYGGTVMFAGWDNSGYGNLMRIAIDNVLVAGENRKYWHNYAHLNGFLKGVGSLAERGEQVARSGSSGNTGTPPQPHLHFHITLDINKNDVGQVAVDVSPMRGLRPNLNYPTTGTCGQIEARSAVPMIVEPVAFSQRFQPRLNHYWYCYTDLPRTGECYMYGVPNDGTEWDPLNTTQSPELRYGNVYFETSSTYYLWICGWGGAPADDSLHMGYNGVSPSSSQRMEGYGEAAWRWRSIKSDGTRPYIQSGQGDQMINIWMKEDGMRIDRILLSKNINYDPNGKIRCGGY